MMALIKFTWVMENVSQYLTQEKLSCTHHAYHAFFILKTSYTYLISQTKFVQNNNVFFEFHPNVLLRTKSLVQSCSKAHLKVVHMSFMYNLPQLTHIIPNFPHLSKNFPMKPGVQQLQVVHQDKFHPPLNQIPFLNWIFGTNGQVIPLFQYLDMYLKFVISLVQKIKWHIYALCVNQENNINFLFSPSTLHTNILQSQFMQILVYHQQAFAAIFVLQIMPLDTLSSIHFMTNLKHYLALLNLNNNGAVTQGIYQAPTN